MAYITYQDYVSLYGQPPITEEQFPMYADRASDLVDVITRYKIGQGGGISALPLCIQTLIQKAAAAQVLYFAENDLYSVLTGDTGQGFTVGKVSVQAPASHSGGGNAQAQAMICPMAIALLEQTGLMGREVICSGPYPDSFCGIWP